MNFVRFDSRAFDVLSSNLLKIANYIDVNFNLVPFMLGSCFNVYYRFVRRSRNGCMTYFPFRTSVDAYLRAGKYPTCRAYLFCIQLLFLFTAPRCLSLDILFKFSWYVFSSLAFRFRVSILPKLGHVVSESWHQEVLGCWVSYTGIRNRFGLTIVLLRYHVFRSFCTSLVCCIRLYCYLAIRSLP